jgi:transcriptional regulator with PAS, ATPase and Fis domain
MATLMGYEYPGNVRELKSIIQSALNLTQGKPISTKVLPPYIQRKKAILKKNSQIETSPDIPIAEVEKSHILKVYEQTGRNKSQAAKLLAIGLNTLRRKLESYGVD